MENNSDEQYSIEQDDDEIVTDYESATEIDEVGLGVCAFCSEKTIVAKLSTGRVYCENCLSNTIDCSYCCKRLVDSAFHNGDEDEDINERNDERDNRN